MHRISQWLRLSVLALCGVAVCACAPKTPSPTTPQPPVAVGAIDLQGRPLDPLASAMPGRRATVLLFITNDCPISNSYAPEIQRMCDGFTKQGVTFVLVYSDPALAPDAASRHYREYGYDCTAVIDVKHELARKYGAKVTPEAVVVMPDGAMAYRGRINDWYIDFGKARYNATTSDLRDVLESVVQGRPVAFKSTEAVGCYIPL